MKGEGGLIISACCVATRPRGIAVIELIMNYMCQCITEPVTPTDKVWDKLAKKKQIRAPLSNIKHPDLNQIEMLWHVLKERCA